MFKTEDWEYHHSPFQDTYWLSNAAAAIGSSWHGQALPPPILLLLELAQISASHSPQAGRLQHEFLESNKHMVHSTLTNYIIHWAYTVVGAVNLGIVPKQATSWPRVWPQLDIPVEFRPHWNISGFEFFSPLSNYEYFWCQVIERKEELFRIPRQACFNLDS